MVNMGLARRDLTYAMQVGKPKPGSDETTQNEPSRVNATKTSLAVAYCEGESMIISVWAFRDCGF